jgi:hypothetical protein
MLVATNVWNDIIYGKVSYLLGSVYNIKLSPGNSNYHELFPDFLIYLGSKSCTIIPINRDKE